LIYLKKSITRTDFVEVIDTSELVSEAIKWK
jgi:hypothetical protein